MTYTDNFAIIGKAADDFDCDGVGGWTAGGTANTPIATNSARKQGTLSLELRGTAGLMTYSHDLGPTDGDRMKVYNELLCSYLRYSKGKGASYLAADGSAIVWRLFFGGTTDYADYRPTDNGDESLVFGWNLLQVSGTELNGGVPNFAIVNAGSFVSGREYIITTVGNTNWALIGGPSSAETGDRFTATGSGSGTGAASDTTSTDWDRFIHRIEVRITLANANDKDSEDAPILMDCWFSGTKFIVSEGTVGGTQVDLDDLNDWARNTRSGFPVDLIDVVEDVFVDLRAGIDVGNGSNGINNEGNFAIPDKYKEVLLNSWSKEVPINITCEEFSRIQTGTFESGTDGDYAVRGVRIVTQDNRDCDFICKEGSTADINDTKFFKLLNVQFGGSIDTTSQARLRRVIVDSCDKLILYSPDWAADDLEVLNARAETDNWPVEIHREPTSCKSFLVHDCNQGPKFFDDIDITKLTVKDVTGVHATTVNNKTVNFISSDIDYTKLEQVT